MTFSLKFPTNSRRFKALKNPKETLCVKTRKHIAGLGSLVQEDGSSPSTPTPEVNCRRVNFIQWHSRSSDNYYLFQNILHITLQDIILVVSLKLWA